MNTTDTELLVRHQARELHGLPVLPIPLRIIIIKVTIGSENILTITLTIAFIIIIIIVIWLTCVAAGPRIRLNHLYSPNV